MAEETIIAWTDNTFNPWMGCDKVSAGCKNCYAERLVSGRMGVKGLWGGRGFSRRRTSRANWRKPLAWNRAAGSAGRSMRVFCASLCDVFEDRRQVAPWREDLWQLIRETPNLDWQLLTKRPENIQTMLPKDWGDGYGNVWLGTTVEDRRVVGRVDHLRDIPAVIRFISYEPAIGPIADDVDLSGIHWVIYGGESGPGYRPEDKQWARDVRDLCAKTGAAFFHKQSAGYRTELGIRLDGRLVRKYPVRRRRVHPIVV